MKTNSRVALFLFQSASVAGFFNWDGNGDYKPDIFKWSEPFPSDGTPPGGFAVACHTEATFHAKQYKLSELRFPPPEGLLPWTNGISAVLGRIKYPGHWDGIDRGGDDREVLMMEYAEVPGAVKDWIEEQKKDWENPKRWQFGVFEKPKKEEDFVYDTVGPKKTPVPGGVEISTVPDEDKIMVFAAGALYPIMPLWVAEWSECEAGLTDLNKYDTHAKHNGTIAWPYDITEPDRAHGQRDITFKIRAAHVLETEEGRNWRQMWDKLYASARRYQRRQNKKEREAARKAGLDPDDRAKDEL